MATGLLTPSLGASTSRTPEDSMNAHLNNMMVRQSDSEPRLPNPTPSACPEEHPPAPPQVRAAGGRIAWVACGADEFTFTGAIGGHGFGPVATACSRPATDGSTGDHHPKAEPDQTRPHP